MNDKIFIQIKHMLFAGDCYYPDGGWDDFKGYFNSIELAQNYMYENCKGAYEWAHIVNDGKIVKRFEKIYIPEEKIYEWIEREV